MNISTTPIDDFNGSDWKSNWNINNFWEGSSFDTSFLRTENEEKIKYIIDIYQKWIQK
jgi:hypothetical protein